MTGVCSSAEGRTAPLIMLPQGGGTISAQAYALQRAACVVRTPAGGYVGALLRVAHQYYVCVRMHVCGEMKENPKHAKPVPLTHLQNSALPTSSIVWLRLYVFPLLLASQTSYPFGDFCRF